VLEGLVQHDYPLSVQHILHRMRTMGGAAEVATLTDDGITRASHAEVAERAERLAAGLAELGVGSGDRVATFSWNTQAHLEAYLAIPSMGAVLHTLNLRLFPEQLAYVVNHARDKVILVDASVAPALAKVAPELEHVEHYVLVGDGDAEGLEPLERYEELLARHDGFDWPALDERQAAGLCYTSGTTGNPKGVLYSHRSTLLHAAGACLADSLGVSAHDRVLPVVPMFHASAWGLAQAAPLVGADLVMPGRFLEAEALAGLIEGERVTLAGAVPTIWLDLLRYAEEHRPDLTSLRMVVGGGSAVPRALMEGFDAHEVRIVQAWGMTETSPLGSVAHLPRGVEEDEEWSYRTSQGRLSPLVEARVVGDDGAELPWDGESAGELEVRGPWVASRYYEDPTGDDKFHDGWMRTGDIASIDSRGYIRISDRAKDVIKSGGEWISSVDLENELMAHPDVEEAAVVAMPHDRWIERPLACVVCREDAGVEPDALREHLSSRVAKWWLPDGWAFIDEVPKTATGKFDKKALRARLADGELEVRGAEGEPARPS
jgi:acyl-CoA synthetase (AMP-forming)/AMP-acid ligase II